MLVADDEWRRAAEGILSKVFSSLRESWNKKERLVV